MFEFIKRRSKMLEEQKRRSSAVFVLDENGNTGRIKTWSPKASPDGNVEQMIGWTEDIIRNNNSNDSKTKAIVEKYSVLFYSRCQAIFQDFDLAHKIDNLSSFTRNVEKTFWLGWSHFIKVKYRTDVESAKIKPTITKRVNVLGKGPTVIKEVDTKKLEEYRMDIINAMYDQGGNDKSRLNPLKRYALDKFILYADRFFKTFKKCLQVGLDVNDALELSSLVYGHDGTLFDEMSKPPYSLEPRVIAETWKFNRVNARESFLKWAQVGQDLVDKYWGKEVLGEIHQSERHYIPSRQALMRYILNNPRTVEQGLELLDEKLDSLIDTYRLIPKDVIVSNCISYPFDSQEDNGTETGFREKLNNIVEKVENLNRAFPMARKDEYSLFSRYSGTDKTLFEEMDLVGLLYILSSRKGSKFNHEYVNSAVQKAIGIIRENKTESRSAKRRILIKCLKEGDDANVNRIINAENKRAKEIKRIVDLVDGKLPDKWGEYFVLFGSTNIVRPQGRPAKNSQIKYARDFLSHGILLVELVLDHYGILNSPTQLVVENDSLIIKPGEYKKMPNVEDSIEEFLANIFEIIEKYKGMVPKSIPKTEGAEGGSALSTVVKIIKDPKSFSLLCEAYLLAPENPKAYYNRIYSVLKDQVDKKVEFWGEDLRVIPYISDNISDVEDA